MNPSTPPGPAPSTRSLPARRCLAALCAAGTALLAATAHAAAPFTADPDPDPLDAHLDLATGEHPTQDAATGSFTVGFQAMLHLSSQADESTAFGAFAFVQVPLARLAEPPRRALAPLPLSPLRTLAPLPLSPLPLAEPPRRTLAPLLSPLPLAEPPRRTLAPLPLAEPPRAPAPPPAPEATSPPSEPAPAPLLTPELARGAVRAAVKTAKLDDAEQRLDTLASRAKSSALLPELRLRATRAIDESEALSPTEYDPLRRTAGSGSSTWLEARATFRLDRLVFADDELAVERLRMARAAERAKLVAKVLDLLDAWQRARAAENDPSAKPEARRSAALAAAASEASLDVLTGGWFAKALAAASTTSAGRSDSAAAPPTVTPPAADLGRDRSDRSRADRDAAATDGAHDATHPSPAERSAAQKK